MTQEMPFAFRDIVVRRPGYQSARFYALLREAFGEDELESQTALERDLYGARDRRNRAPHILIGRFGLLRWRKWWKLVTPVAVGAISGNYLSMGEIGRPGEGIGALGHLITHPTYGRGQGHGKALTEAFERHVAQAAEHRRERLRLVILEAVPEARGFWASRGYRFLAGVRYVQPPLLFNPETDEPLHAAHPLTLMVKLWDSPDAKEIDSELLADSVRIIYHRWYIPTDYSEPVVRRITDYVFGNLFADFLASLPASGAPVMLRESAE